MAATNPLNKDLFPPGTTTPEWIVAKTLTVDPRYQREIDPKQVNEIAAGFDPDLIGGLICSQRVNGDIVVLDGQTRLAAIMQMRYDDQRIPCFVHRGLTPEREAYIFEMTNVKRRGMSPYAIWRSQLFRREAEAIAIKKILDGLGLHFANGRTRSENGIHAIKTVRMVYDTVGGIGLHRVLRVLRNAWHTQTGYDRNLVHGMALVLAEYPSVKDETLIKRLQKIEPEALLRQAAHMKGTHGDNLASYTAFVVVDVHNKQARGSERLPVRGPAELGKALAGLRAGVSTYKKDKRDA